MHPDRWKRLQELFDDVSAKPPEERAAFLDDACGDDAGLRSEVEELLKHDAEAGESVYEAVGMSAETLLSADEPLETGAVIGPYEIVTLVGRGGMGEVYEAAQLKPVRRRVALKLIRKGLHGRSFVVRFEGERQALALMGHPNIARVYDAGATTDGRPYLAMEFVQGVPITRFCDERKLPLEERLGLFADLCDGVQHAHQRGVIHRDLKPSNVLVSDVEGRRVLKIIDFGVAKATAQRLTEVTMVTEVGQLIGTPEYMSPEQAGLAGLDVDTRTDVYTLGVLLYELLAGALPFDGKRLRELGFDELRRIIREVDPPAPCARVAVLGEEADRAAANRRTDRGTLARRLRGELDWIVMKAIEKERSRRYQSARDLADDVRRFLRHEPVLAVPPGAVYRVRKFVRRHRLGTAATLLVILAVLTTIVGTSLGLVRARRAERQARRDAATAEQVSRFMIDLFAVSDPGEARGRTITAREILDRGSRRITDTLATQPEVQARMMLTMGTVYRSLGLIDDARRLLTGSLRVRRGLGGDRSPGVAETLAQLGNLEGLAGNHSTAVELLRDSLDISRAESADEPLRIATTMHDLGHAHFLLTEFDEAEALYRDAIDIMEGLELADVTPLAAVRSSLAQLLHTKGDFEASERLFRQTLEMRIAALGEDHPDIGEAKHNLATVLHDQRRLDEAERLLRESLEISIRVQGADHPDVADTLVNLGRLLREKGDMAGAEEVLRRTLEIDRAIHGDEHENVAYDLKELAGLMRSLDRAGEAEELYRESAAMYRRVVQEDNPYLSVVLNGLGRLLAEQGRPREAEPLFREALEITARALPESHWLTLTIRSRLGECLGSLNRHAEGEPLVVGSYAAFEESLGADDERSAAALERVIRFYDSWSRDEEAAAWRGRRATAGPISDELR